MFKTIRARLLTILLAFVIVTVISSIVAFNYYENKKDSLSGITQKAENTHILLLKDIKTMHDFFENETINSDFFESGKSSLVEAHKTTCVVIDSVFTDLNGAQEKNNFELGDTIKNIEKDFKKYKLFTGDIFTKILARGFKDYGIEGRMRDYAHRLENYQTEIGLIGILQLRRHEKDFIIRQEDHYIIKHNSLVADIKEKVLSNRAMSPDKKNEIIIILNNYSAQFNNLVAYEKRLGLKSGEGLKKQIDVISSKIEASLARMVHVSAYKEEAAIRNVNLVYLLIGLIFLAIGIVSALIISKRVSGSITHLKVQIDEFVKSDFTVRTILPINDSVNEIDVLITNFSVMEQHIVNQMSAMKQANKDLEMLFYVTSNDIRFPLLHVQELTNRAFVKSTDPEVKDSLYMINQSWEKLLNIVEELGIVTNIRNTTIKTELIDIEAIIRSVYAEFRSYELFDTVIFSLDFKIKNKFYSSPGLLKAIFRNLLENSVKYATKRTSFSFIKVSVTDQNDEMLRIEITDNGIGIKEEYLDRIFEMFFRGTEYAGGTGLGLYIVKSSVEKLNGAITVESVEGLGTTFTLLIPNNYRRQNIRERIIHNKEILQLANSLYAEPAE